MESVPEQTACIDLTDTDVLWDFICRNESLSLFESIFFMVFQIQPSANDSFRHIKSHRTLAINAMKRIIGRGLLDIHRNVDIQKKVSIVRITLLKPLYTPYMF